MDRYLFPISFILRPGSDRETANFPWGELSMRHTLVKFGTAQIHLNKNTKIIIMTVNSPLLQNKLNYSGGEQQSTQISSH